MESSSCSLLDTRSWWSRETEIRGNELDSEAERRTVTVKIQNSRVKELQKKRR